MFHPILVLVVESTERSSFSVVAVLLLSPQLCPLQDLAAAADYLRWQVFQPSVAAAHDLDPPLPSSCVEANLLTASANLNFYLGNGQQQHLDDACVPVGQVLCPQVSSSFSLKGLFILTERLCSHDLYVPL